MPAAVELGGEDVLAECFPGVSTDAVDVAAFGQGKWRADGFPGGGCGSKQLGNVVVTASEGVGAGETLQGECHRPAVTGVARYGQAVQMQISAASASPRCSAMKPSSPRVCAMPGA